MAIVTINMIHYVINCAALIRSFYVKRVIKNIWNKQMICKQHGFIHNINPEDIMAGFMTTSNKETLTTGFPERELPFVEQSRAFVSKLTPGESKDTSHYMTTDLLSIHY